jgi:Flp pilus assembly protein TadD
VRALERALELEPADPDRLARLAFARHAAGDLEGATRDLLLLAERGGEDRFPHRAALGLLLLQSGRTAEARRWLASSRAEEAEYPEARIALARLLMAEGDREAAGRVLREAAARHPRVRAAAAAEPALVALLEDP